ncbi:MAG: SGNH/GDSL hydrolase family protein [Blautia sp.]|nr:SGNH/GDSL hydrolase family protein [Lachnoclostridium sp.]MCM1212431.1 SGNH/GDSL hydrolase family protein [Blautia sp.]
MSNRKKIGDGVGKGILALTLFLAAAAALKVYSGYYEKKVAEEEERHRLEEIAARGEMVQVRVVELESEIAGMAEDTEVLQLFIDEAVAAANEVQYRKEMESASGDSIAVMSDAVSMDRDVMGMDSDSATFFYDEDAEEDWYKTVALEKGMIEEEAPGNEDEGMMQYGNMSESRNRVRRGNLSENEDAAREKSMSGDENALWHEGVFGNESMAWYDSVSGNEGMTWYDSVSGNESMAWYDSVSGNEGMAWYGSVSGNNGMTWYGSVSGNEGMAWYDSVSGNETVSGNGTVSGNDIYMTLEERQALRSSYEETQEVNQRDKETIARNQYDFSKKKVACLGDSITAASNLEKEENYEQYAYPTRLKELLGFEEVYNLGIGGSSIGRYWSEAFVDRYENIPADVDIILVLGGTNDGFCVSDAEFGSLDERARNTFCGDLDELMRGLREHYPEAVIFFATPPANILHDSLMGEQEYLLPQRAFAGVIRALAQEYQFELIDLYNENLLNSHDANIISNYMPDGVHGNHEGYEILAEHFAARIVQYYRGE